MAAHFSQKVGFLLSCLVLALLAMLGLATLFGLVDGPGSERDERVAQTPNFSLQLADLKRLPGDTRFYLQKRYAFKDQFIALNSAVKTGIFSHSPAVNVLLGQDGYLFLNDDGAIAQAQGAGYPTPAAIADWKRHFATLKEEFEQRGIPFVFILAPNKHTVYADALPSWLRSDANPANFTDSVIEEAGQTMDPAPLDLRSVLRDYRTENPDVQLYHRTDTHWNELGAAIAVRASLNTVGLNIAPPQATVEPAGQGGDLARMIGKQDRLNELAPMLQRPAEQRCETHEGRVLTFQTLDPLPHRRFHCSSRDGWPGKALIFMDSFGIGAGPILASSLRDSHFVWQDSVDLGLVDELQPDIVIQILVERKVQVIDPSALLKRVN